MMPGPVTEVANCNNPGQCDQKEHYADTANDLHVFICPLHLTSASALHTHTRLTALCPVLHRWAGTKKVTPIWILLKQETVSGSGISLAICKSAPRSIQDNYASTPPLIFTGRMPFLLPNQQRQSTEDFCTTWQTWNLIQFPLNESKYLPSVLWRCCRKGIRPVKMSGGVLA